MGWIRIFGPPRVLICDPAADNLSKHLVSLLALWGCEVVASAATDRTMTSRVERWGKDLSSLLDKMVMDLTIAHPDATFDQLLALACYTINAETRLRCGISPLMAATGVGAVWPDNDGFGSHARQMYRRICSTRDAYLKSSRDLAVTRALTNRSGRVPHTQWQVGDKARIWSSRLGEVGWRGPGTVTNVNPNTRVLQVEIAGAYHRVSYNLARPVPLDADGIASSHGAGVRLVSDVSVQTDELSSSDIGASEKNGRGDAAVQAQPCHQGDGSRPTSSPMLPVPPTVLPRTVSIPANIPQPPTSRSPNLGLLPPKSGDTQELSCNGDQSSSSMEADPTECVGLKDDVYDVPKGHHVVDKILGHVKVGRGYRYHLKWRAGDTSWEPGAHLRNASDIVSEYWAAQRHDQDGKALACAELDLRRYTDCPHPHCAFRTSATSQDSLVEGSSIILPNGKQAIVDCVALDCLRVIDHRGRPDIAHPARVCSVPTWRQQAHDLGPIIEDALFASNVHLPAPGDLPVLADIPAYALVSHSILKKKEVLAEDFNPAVFDAAKRKEFDKLFRFDAIRRVHADDFDGELIDGRFVCTFKPEAEPSKQARIYDARCPQLSRASARWVMKGFQQVVDDLTDNSSPTPSWQSVLLVLQSALQRGVDVHIDDVEGAFLQSDPISSNIAFVPPTSCNEPPGIFYQVYRNLYGLKGAPRAWYEKIAKYLVDNLGFVRSKADSCLFILPGHGSLVMHVDDFLWEGDKTMIEAMDALKLAFKFGDSAVNEFTYCGITIKCDPANGFVTLNLSTYIRQSLYEIPVDADTDVGVIESDLRSLLGMTQFISGKTRPDIACSTSALAGELSAPSWVLVKRVNKLVRYLQHTSNVPLILRRLDPASMCLVGHGDSAYRNMPRYKTQGGHLLYLRDNSGMVSLIGWSSKRLPRDYRSTFGCELKQQVLMSDDLRYCKFLLADLMSHISVQIHMRTDCESLVNNVHSYRQTVSQKTMIPDLNALHELLVLGDISSFEYTPSRLNPSDGMTKPEADLRIPILRLMSGASITWVNDPLITQHWRPQPIF